MWGASCCSFWLFCPLDFGFKSCPRVGGIFSSLLFWLYSIFCFKSCPRVGGIRTTLIVILVLSVSSRAPVWGASINLLWGTLPPWFQVVPPCGGHPLQLQGICRPLCFKSCPRVGGIGAIEKISGGEGVSSRAPVWGASEKMQSAAMDAAGFKSCPRVGGIRE